MNKIKKGDEVLVITGKSKGAQGKVLKVLIAEQRVLVEGVNLVKKHLKPNPNTNTKGGIVERESPLHISNVALFEPVSKKAAKVGFKTLEDGRKVRYFKSSGEMVEAS